jgi:F-type H+-transporting ATPase subunit gamma
MANLKEIRIRRESTASTRQITSAMKMVSAAKLKKAQDAITQLRPYAEKLQEILGSISDSLKDDEGNIYAQNRDVESVLLVLITSNRGLCGAFNSNAIKAAIHEALETHSDQMMAGKVHFIAIGKKGYEFLKKNGYNVVFNGSELFDDLNFDRSTQISEMMMKLYVEGDYDRVDIVYNQFKNAATQILTTEQFLPIKIDEVEEREEAFSENMDYIFEPSKEYIMHEMIPRSLKLQFYKSVLDSFASEHGARMTAMHMATDNATDLMKELALEYNKARQSAITNEIIEIVSGAEALG